MPSVERSGVEIWYETIDLVPPWVEEPPTVLFHHGIGTTSAIWSDWLPVLVDYCRIVRFDTRGFGRSSHPPPDFVWTMETLIADALAVADAAGARRFHFVGESAGGTAGLAAALAHPERFATLTMSNAAHRGTAIRNVRGAWRDRMAGDGQAAWAREMMERRFHPGALSPAKEAWFLKEQATCSTEATLGIADLLLRTDLSPLVGEVRMPVLLLSPDGSPFVSAAMMAELHAQLADAELQVFAHAKHGLPFSHGRECAAALRGFIERRARAA